MFYSINWNQPNCSTVDEQVMKAIKRNAIKIYKEMDGLRSIILNKVISSQKEKKA